MGLASQAHADKSQRWWHLSSIQLAGGLISIPVISVGSQIYVSSGLAIALLSIILGNALIFLASYFVIQMSFKHRYNAIENASQFLGKITGRILAFFILLSGISWIAWELYSGVQLLQIHPFFARFNFGSVIGALAALVLLIGIRGLKNLCLYATIPLLALLFTLLLIVDPPSELGGLPSHFGFAFTGISLAISSSVVAVVDYPTFFRHSKTKRDSIIALIVIFGVTSLLQIVGILLFKMFTQDTNLLASILYKNNFNSYVTIVFLIISMLTSVCWNIYAASVGWESLFPIFKDRTEYAVIGLVAVALFSNLRLEEFFASSATFIDCLVAGVCGVLVYAYLQQQHRKIRTCVLPLSLSWLLAAIAAVFVYFGFFLASQDCLFIGLIVGFLAAFLFSQLAKASK